MMVLPVPSSVANQRTGHLTYQVLCSTYIQYTIKRDLCFFLLCSVFCGVHAKENCQKVYKHPDACQINCCRWEQHKDKLRLIEVLTGLQMCLEPVAESLVVADRVAFLQENGTHDIKLVRMMDSRLSPRSLAYIVSKS